VVLIHDFPLNSRMWEPQIAGLQDRCRLVAPDLAGFGLSPSSDSALSLAHHASDVLDVVNLLETRNLSVVGSGVGGLIALHLVEELGARLLGLLLVSTSVTPDAPNETTWRHELAAEVGTRGVDTVADEFLPKLLGRTTQQDSPEILDSVGLMVRENTPAGVADLLRAMAAQRQHSFDLTRIRCPVLCVGGGEDILTPAESIYSMADRVSGALTEIIPEAGHLPNLEVPEVFNDSILRLLAECKPA
jgi:pimeloyl-ACP methyl ester carboxylesterase